MEELLHIKPFNVPASHKNEHDGYEYYRRKLVPIGAASQCTVSIYEIPPGKSAYPYHYHAKNEEVFYIISGSGILKTPGGDKTVSAGDFLFFPASEKGAHKLTNTSESEMLVYLDFDTRNDIDMTFYPDSQKIGVWGKDVNRLYRIDDNVDYYDGE